MTPDLARIQDGRTSVRAAPGWSGGEALRGTAGWYWDASGGFIPGTPDTWNPHVAFLVFPRITSSPRIERRAMSRFAARSHHISTLPVADQVRELQRALSVNKSELARILRVSRPTVYDWLDDGQPNAGNVSRIRTLLRLLWESRVTPANPLFPRFVRSALEPGDRPLLDVLSWSRRRSTKRPCGVRLGGRRRWAMPFTPGARSVKPGCGQPVSRNRTPSNGRPILLRMWRSWSGRGNSDGA